MGHCGGPRILNRRNKWRTGRLLNHQGGGRGRLERGSGYMGGGTRGREDNILTPARIYLRWDAFPETHDAGHLVATTCHNSRCGIPSLRTTAVDFSDGMDQCRLLLTCLSSFSGKEKACWPGQQDTRVIPQMLNFQQLEPPITMPLAPFPPFHVWWTCSRVRSASRVEVALSLPFALVTLSLHSRG